MSHYSRGALKIDGPACLILALEELGFKPEYHETAQNLRGYQGDIRPEVANVIIPRAQISSAANDIGFYFAPGGECEAIISDFDSHRHGAAWVGKVKQLSGVHSALAKAKALGHRAQRVAGEAGQIFVRVSGSL